MAIYHCSTKIVSRANGQSAVAAAAYRSGEKLKNEQENKTHDYTKKEQVLHSEITIPIHAPEWAKNREQLWNHVEAAEKNKDAQLARVMNVALPVELNFKQQRELSREFMQTFADKGMVADWSIHSKDSNPHIDIMLTMRPFNQDGSWGAKQKKEYILDKDGNKQYDPKKRQYKCRTVKTTDWDRHESLEEWRETWASIANKYLERAGCDTRIDHRSNKDRGIPDEPTIHMGHKLAAIEQKQINQGLTPSTSFGNHNREIKAQNRAHKKPLTLVERCQQFATKGTSEEHIVLMILPKNYFQLNSNKQMQVKNDISKAIQESTQNPKAPGRSDQRRTWANNLVNKTINNLKQGKLPQQQPTKSSQASGGGGSAAPSQTPQPKSTGVVAVDPRFAEENPEIDWYALTKEEITEKMAEISRKNLDR